MFLTVDGGILSPITKIFGIIMNSIFIMLDKIGIQNGAIGLAIIIFTLITRIILYPMTINQQKSSKLMTIIQPEVNAIQKKYEGKKDQASMMAMQQEIKAVYEKYGTSMTGNCLQLVIQMPIIFALYRVIMNIPAYVESIKEHFTTIVDAIGGVSVIPKLQEFATNNNLDALVKQVNNFGTTAQNISVEQQKNYIIDFLYKLNPEQIKLLMSSFSTEVQNIAENSLNFINSANSFLGLNLATAPNAFGFNVNPYWLIPILAFASQYLSIQLMQKSSRKVQVNDENNQMQQTMKTMNLMMPIMSAFFTWGFATGIGIYWIASAIFMTIQQYIVNKQMENIDLDELIKQNIKKANLKRAKKGLPPINENQTVSNIKKMEEKQEKIDKEREKVLEGKVEREEAAEKYYFDNEVDKDSLFAKANMVAKYNEKNDKKK